MAQREEAQEREAEQARRVVRRTLIGMAVAIVLLLATAALAVGLAGASREADERLRAAETLHTEHEQVYQAIIEAAVARKCDLIVMASHGRRGVSAVVLGSETVKVLTHSKIPVLVYR